MCYNSNELVARESCSGIVSCRFEVSCGASNAQYLISQGCFATMDMCQANSAADALLTLLIVIRVTAPIGKAHHAASAQLRVHFVVACRLGWESTCSGPRG